LEQKPEQRVAYGIMKFFGNGDVCFVAYGRNSADEFFTERLQLKDLIKSDK
jgi:hypothetical protein